MTMAEIRKTDKDFLTPADVGEALGSHPQWIRETARQYPERIGYPFTFIGNRMKIPTKGFLRWADGKETEQ